MAPEEGTKEVEVSWSTIIHCSSATSPRDAAQTAYALLIDAIDNPVDGQSIVVVRDLGGRHLGTFDQFGMGEEIAR